MTPQVFTGARVFDGTRLHEATAVVIEDGRIAALLPEEAAPKEGRIALRGGILAPGLLDLQVNGGGGVMLDGTADIGVIHTICRAHLGLGTTGLLPTLITDTPEATAQVIAAGLAAAQARVPGFLGLHLEGPHLDPQRKGAHDPALIRPMQPEDLALLCDAAQKLPSLMITLSPDAATPDQIARLSHAGAIISLGHSDAGYDSAVAAMAAGASCVTHLFNAMSQMTQRAPGLVGAALTQDSFVGIIADGVHVLTPALIVAVAAKRPGRMFLVSDAMAPAGTDITGFDLGGRHILRRDGRLTLADGTLAGADLSLPQAIRFMVRAVGVPVEIALAMATSIPAACLHRSDHLGHLRVARHADMVHLDDDFRLQGVWQAGVQAATPT